MRKVRGLRRTIPLRLASACVALSVVLDASCAGWRPQGTLCDEVHGHGLERQPGDSSESVG